MEMQTKTPKPGVVAKIIASIFLLLELIWLRTTLPDPFVSSDNAFTFLYFYFFIILFVGPFFMFDGIHYLKTRYQLQPLDKLFFFLEIVAVLAILFVFLVTAGIIRF